MSLDFLKGVAVLFKAIILLGKKSTTCNETIDIFILIFNAYSNNILVSW